MRFALPYTSRVFARAIAMPNLRIPLTDAALCARYHEDLTVATTDDFEPMVTLYLTDNTTSTDITDVKPNANTYDQVFGAKLYPKGTTTGSEYGVANIKDLYPVFETMQQQKLPLLLHGESAESNIDFYDREKRFIETTLIPIRKYFPELKIVLEHITTREAVDVVRTENNICATITPHHLLYNRNALFDGGLRPHRYCLPPAQRENDRISLIDAAISGNKCFFAGTDSAPHQIENKHCDHGCAGIFNAPVALETYTEIFEQAGALNNLEDFVSVNGAAFYGIERNKKHLKLVKTSWRVPEILVADCLQLVPFRAGETITWQVSTQVTLASE